MTPRTKLIIYAEPGDWISALTAAQLFVGSQELVGNTGKSVAFCADGRKFSVLKRKKVGTISVRRLDEEGIIDGMRRYG